MAFPRLRERRAWGPVEWPIESPVEWLDGRITKFRRALSLECRSCKCLPPIVAAG